MSENSRLRILDDRKPIWRRPEDSVVDQVIVPALREADSFDCMVGFFGGGALRELSHGLASYIARSKEPLRLLVSPVISDDDQESIRLGIKNPAAVLEEAIILALHDEVALASALAQHTRKCLAYLIAVGRLRMKVVFIRDAKFHVKEWIFRAQDDVVVLSGSANFTGAALAKNVEQLHLHRSWRGADNAFVCKDTQNEFNLYWSNKKAHAVAVDLPIAVSEDLLHNYETEHAPTIEEYRNALKAEGLSRRDPVSLADEVYRSQTEFRPPKNLVWEVGPYSHQGDAVFAWEANGRRGILAMATGAGKTITALIAAWRLYRETGQLLIVISAPTRPLVSQWDDEARSFGLKPYCAGSDGKASRLKQVDSRLSNQQLRVSSVETLIVTNDLLNSIDFRRLLSRFRGPTLLIADEVHNLGSEEFLSNLPEHIPHRLGLSATPERQYDQIGTETLIDFFGRVVFEFDLSQAIGVCLVPYDYYLHQISLSSTEISDYRKYSERIRNIYLSSKGNLGVLDNERLQRLLNQRRLVLETAEEKLAVLRDVLVGLGTKSLHHSLIYTTDKAPTQLLRVNQMLEKLDVRYHQITSSETSQANIVSTTLDAFRAGYIQALTAKRVLDEGLNVPEISTAFILASTTVRRQWVQRRGRVLRMCSSIKKDFANIHDFVVLPPADEPLDDDIRKLVGNELDRCDEFTELARNRASRSGPRELIQNIRLSYIV